MSLPTVYDHFFRRHSDDIPIKYLRALTMLESGFRPGVNAKGLMQITPVARADYNEHHPSDQISRADLQDPEKNIKIGTWLLRRYADALDTSGIRPWRENWFSREFARAITAGWNSGVFGLIKAAKRVANRGGVVSHESAMAEWRETNEFLASRQKEKWQRKVADLYFAQLNGGGSNDDNSGGADPDPDRPSGPLSRRTPTMGGAILGVGIGAAFFFWAMFGDRK